MYRERANTQFSTRKENEIKEAGNSSVRETQEGVGPTYPNTHGSEHDEAKPSPNAGWSCVCRSPYFNTFVVRSCVCIFFCILYVCLYLQACECWRPSTLTRAHTYAHSPKDIGQRPERILVEIKKLKSLFFFSFPSASCGLFPLQTNGLHRRSVQEPFMRSADGHATAHGQVAKTIPRKSNSTRWCNAG